MRVLVADAFERTGLDGLRAAGCDVLYEPDLKEAALAERLRTSGARVLVVRGTVVDAAALQSDALALVVRAGAGINTIDVKTASRRGIYVSNCPGKNAIAVAELTFGLILAIDRRIPDATADLRAGRWNKKEYGRARGLAGRTIGLLGYGHIGHEVARRAHAFGMTVAVWSRRFAAGGGAGGGEAGDVPIRVSGSPHELARSCDILSVHLALAPDTRGLVDASLLAALRDGAYVINTARAEIVDSAALAEAVTSRGLRAGLDVFDHEPAASSGPFAPPLAALPGVYGTHHIGASTEQAQEAIAAETVRIVAAFAATGKVPNVVNLAARTPATHLLVVRHRDRPGVLAHVFACLRQGGVNVQETENVIFDGAEAAVARIHLGGLDGLDAAPGAALLEALRTGNDDVIDVSLLPL